METINMIDTTNGIRICKKCEIEKPLSEFDIRTKAKPYPRNNCRDCVNTYRREYAKKNPHWQKHYMLKSQYGIGIDDYLAMKEQQDGLCAICEQPPSEKQPYLAVDHDHKTGKVRALLCSKCNMSLGGLNEDVGLLLKMIAYIQTHSDITDVASFNGNN